MTAMVVGAESCYTGGTVKMLCDLRWCVGIVAVTCGWLAGHQTARACVEVASPEPAPFAVDPSLKVSDSDPPAAFENLSASVYRTANTVCRDGTCTSSSCGPFGTVEIHYHRTDADEGGPVGVRMTVVGGTLPNAMRRMVDAAYPLPAGHLRFELGFAQATEVDAVITLTAIDRAGNESPPSAPVELRWSGCTTALVGGVDGCLDEASYDCSEAGCTEKPAASALGCSAGDGAVISGVGPAALAMAGMALVARRRRRG